MFAAYGAWRATGLQRAGAALARALASSDETNRTAAGMLLLRGGMRALPLLQNNLRQALAVPLTLRVLGDIGSPEARSAIQPFLRDADPAVARAATEALASLDAVR